MFLFNLSILLFRLVLRRVCVLFGSCLISFKNSFCVASRGFNIYKDGVCINFGCGFSVRFAALWCLCLWISAAAPNTFCVVFRLIYLIVFGSKVFELCLGRGVLCFRGSLIQKLPFKNRVGGYFGGKMCFLGVSVISWYSVVFVYVGCAEACCDLLCCVFFLLFVVGVAGFLF